MVIFVLFRVPQHPPQELNSGLRGKSRTIRRSATSGPRTQVGVFGLVLWWCQHPARELVLFGLSQDCVVWVFLWWCQQPARELVLFGVLEDCGGVVGVFVVVFLVVVRWCFCGGVVFLWWCCGGVFGVFVVSTSGPRTRTFPCFARLWCFCAAVFGLFVVVFCGGVVVFLWWCFCAGVFGVFAVVFLVVVRWCFYGGAVVFLWWCCWCFCAGVFGVFVVVFLVCVRCVM